MTQKHAYIQFANKILDFKSNGINMIKGRTSACLAGDHLLAAEGHTQAQRNHQNLTKERKEPIRTTNTEKTQKPKSTKSSEIYTEGRA